MGYGMGDAFPESALVRRTLTLREMDLPPTTALTKRSLLRWVSLSLGLISQKESRSTFLDVFDAFLHFQLTKGKEPNTQELRDFLKEKYKKSVSEKLIQYHMGRLVSLHLVECRKRRYSLNNAPNSERGDLKQSFNHWFGSALQRSSQNVEYALDKLEKTYQ